MPIIEVYSDKLASTPVETHTVRSGQTFAQWLRQQTDLYHPSPDQPISVELNKTYVAPELWGRLKLKDGDVVVVVAEPGNDPFIWAAIVLSVVSAAYTIYALNNLPKPPTDPGSSSSIYDPNAQGNKARLNDVVEEHFGRFPCFPSYLNQPRRVYINDEIWLYLCLSRGVGTYTIHETLIGNTPITDGGDIDLLHANPNVDVTSHIAHLNIYTSPEVGATSGTAGIEITGPVESVTPNTGGYVLFGTFTVSVYNLIDGAIIKDEFPFFDDTDFTISGSDTNNGTYNVTSVTDDIATVTKVGDPSWTGFDTGQETGVTLTADAATFTGEWIGPYYACPEGETTDQIWLSFAFNEGLVRYDNDGDKNNKTVEVEYEYSLNDGSTWTSGTYSRTEATPDQLGETISVSVTTGRPLVRVRRVTGEVDSSKVRDKIDWVSLQAELETPSSYPFSTTLLGIRGTNNLAQTAENKIRVDQTRHLPDYRNGAWVATQATESITAAALYVAKEVGYTDAELDLAAFDALGQVLDARGDYFAATVDRDQTAWETLKQILACGYAEPTLDNGLLTPIRDQARTAIEHVYPVEVQMEPGLEREIILWDPGDVTDGVEVEYINRDTAKPETVTYLLGSDAGVRPEKVQAFGICDKTRAWRFGARKRRQRVYQTTKFMVTTEQAALVSRYGSFVGFTDGIPLQSAQSGLVEAVSGQVLMLDRAPTWGSGVHYLGLRLPDGTLSGPFVATQTSDTQVTLTGTLPTIYTRLDPTYQIPTVWLFGPADDWTVRAIITSIRPGQDETVEIEAVNYDARVYNDDDNSPP